MDRPKLTRELIAATAAAFCESNSWHSNQAEDLARVCRNENMDGYEFIQWLRREADNENRFVPILLLTGETRLSHVFRGRDCGANFVVAKPISPKVLLDRMTCGTIVDEPK